MKFINKFLLLTLLVTMAIAGCRNVGDLPFYDKGTPVTLVANKTDVTPTVADSSSEVVRFSWSDPKYALDSNKQKFILEIDSTGRNFAKKVTKEVIGAKSVGLDGRELNNILLNYGFRLGSPYRLDVRVVSSYENNNERYISNVVNISVTPFTDSSRLTSSATTVTSTLATASSNAVTFSWSRSFTGFTGAVTYSIQ